MVIELFFALRLSIKVGGCSTPGGGALRFRTVILLAETGPALKPPAPPPVAALSIDSGDDCVDVEDLSAVDVRVALKGRFKLGATLTSCDLTTMFGPGRTFRTAVPAPPTPPIVFVITRSCLRPLRNDIAALLEPPAAEPAVTVLGGGLLIAIR